MSQKHRRGPFQYADRVQLTGPKGRRHSITLTAGEVFHSQYGMVKHDDIVGNPEGSVFETPQGSKYLALRPMLRDFVMGMPRGAAIVYPKDAAQIISLADIGPNMNVVEAGVGSGALTLHLLRALGGTGRLRSVERREEFAEIAEANVSAFYGRKPENWELTVGDFQEVFTSEPAQHSGASSCSAGNSSGDVDRIVLDMLAPWECVSAVAHALIPGGIVLCYVATVTQLSRVTEEFRRHGGFTRPEASETLVRGWHVEGLAVRPDHRMVAHTGFLVCARRLADGAELPEHKRPASKDNYDESDILAWTPDLLDEPRKSDKVIRKKVREAQRFASGLKREQ
jgi:tRNA (adenine57-N1/adenine58-N1)-methyltransferase